MTQDVSTGDAIERILTALDSDEFATFQWLMDEIRNRFGASDRFDPNDSAFGEMAAQLASKVL